MMITSTDSTAEKRIINKIVTIVAVIIMRVEIVKEFQTNHIRKRKSIIAQIADKSRKKIIIAEDQKSIIQEVANIQTNNLQKIKTIKETTNSRKATKNINEDIAVPAL